MIRSISSSVYKIWKKMRKKNWDMPVSTLAMIMQLAEVNQCVSVLLIIN